MGEARKKQISQAEMLRRSDRCIYCACDDAEQFTVEHMPPKIMFRGSERPSGMEFAACQACNTGTRGADLAAAYLARLSPFDAGGQKTQEAKGMHPMLDIRVPGFREELFAASRVKRSWGFTPGRVLAQQVEIEANGPIVKSCLGVFAAKLGMALYKEHVGVPLPLEGGVSIQTYLNRGLAEEAMSAYLNMLPVAGNLRQGRKNVDDQFVYRFNTDERTIVAALASFNDNLFVFLVATADDRIHDLVQETPYAQFIRPGELTANMLPATFSAF